MINQSTHAIVNPHSGLCLDDQWGHAENGNQIWVYTCNGTPAQQWTLEPIITLPHTATINPVLYESTTQNAANGESALTLLKALKANFVFRGVFQWGAASPVSANNFASVKNSITQLKQATPGLAYEGGIDAQYFEKNSTWPNGTPVTAAEFASIVGRDKQGAPLVLTGFNGYVPDLASPVYRRYLVQWSEKQIDAGVDGIFFDEPFDYAHYKVGTLGGDGHTVYSQYANYFYNDVVGQLRSYAAARHQSFFVTINADRCDSLPTFYAEYPSLLRPDTYISCSFKLDDFNPSTNPTLAVQENLGAIKQAAQAITGRDVPIITFIDWPNELNEFNQLSTQQKLTVLSHIEAATQAQGMYFALPVLIGGMHYDSTGNGTYSRLLQLAANRQ